MRNNQAQEEGAKLLQNFEIEDDKIRKKNTNLMQHCAGFISADSLYMFRASSARHQEY